MNLSDLLNRAMRRISTFLPCLRSCRFFTVSQERAANWETELSSAGFRCQKIDHSEESKRAMKEYPLCFGGDLELLDEFFESYEGVLVFAANDKCVVFSRVLSASEYPTKLVRDSVIGDDVFCIFYPMDSIPFVGRMKEPEALLMSALCDFCIDRGWQEVE